MVFDLQDKSEECEMMDIANHDQNVEGNGMVDNSNAERFWNNGSLENDQHVIPFNMNSIRDDQMDYAAHRAFNDCDALPEEKITAEFMPSANLEEISKFRFRFSV